MKLGELYGFSCREVYIKILRGSKSPSSAKWERGFLRPSRTIAVFFLT